MRILFWFRKDLRLEDNPGLRAAAADAPLDPATGGGVIPFYASEPEILGRDDMAARRVQFALDSLADLARACERAGSRLALDHGTAAVTVVRAARACGAEAVYWNDEYEPALRRRDDAVERALRDTGIRARRFHDRLLVPPGGVVSRSGGPYVVYSAFRRACEALAPADSLPAPVARVTRLAAHDLPERPLATLERLGFRAPARALRGTAWRGGAGEARARLSRFLSGALARYDAERDVPGAAATSRLSADLKFGTIGVRVVARAVSEAARDEPGLRPAADRFLAELRWRDFFTHVLYHFPHCEAGAFRRQYDGIRWRGKPEWLEAWTEGRTGYPIVDAGMRELQATGFLHNRVRMIVASFLTKDLLLDWRAGERWFMRNLIDGDLANNNGGWQWVAGTGTDAQPYFRIFHPVLQGERFDPRGTYVRRWVPELARVPDRWIHRPWESPQTAEYPPPIVDHSEQRDAALEMYEAVKRVSPSLRRG